MPLISAPLLSGLMLFASNVFMTFAWYGHLKFKEVSLPLVILIQLGNCVLRILAGGAGEPLGQRGVFGGSAQDHAGSDHARCVRRFLGLVPEAAARLKSRAGVRADWPRCVFHFPRMVVSCVPAGASSPRLPVAISSDAATMMASASEMVTNATGVFMVGRGQRALLRNSASSRQASWLRPEAALPLRP